MLKKCENNTQEKMVDVDFWSRKRDEEKRIQREKEYQEWEKQIFESEELDFPKEYYNSDWNDTPAAEEEEKILTKHNFLNMDFKECQYHIYKQLVNISSSLSDIKEVLSDGNKAR